MRGILTLGMVSGLALSAGLPGTARAEVPSVAADIPPVHSLVAQVMGDLGTPDLLVRPGASPHGYALRPSEAAALEQADAVFWMGEGLEPWLETAIDALAAGAVSVELGEVEGTTRLDTREGATFEAHDHDHEDDHDHDHGHDHEDDHGHGHDDHDHEDADHGHDDLDHAHEAADADHDHAHDEEAHEEGHHHHEGGDPHAWLDPQNAQVWLDAIASELSRLDPEHAETYAANAAQASARLDGLIASISAELAPVRGRNFIVFHDAYHYFENRFDIPAAGSITLSDASDPSAARVRDLQKKVRDLGVSCAFSEPQYNAGLVSAVFDGTEAKTGVMDPLGAALQPGPELYGQLMQDLSDSLTGCLQ